MKLRSNQLKEHFAKGKVLPVYVLSGDEPLLLQEAADLIRSACRDQGFNERELFNVEPGFDWSELLTAGNTLSLFGDRKILEVRHPKPKFDDTARKALQTYCQDPSPDNVLLLILPRVDKKVQSAKWFQALEQAGAFIQVWPVDLHQLPQWIHQRMQQAGLEPTREAVQLLAERVEGNLLAAAQEVEKLLLLRGGGPIDVRDIEDSVADHARYNLYDLVDEALAGQQEHALRMLYQLRAGGMEPAVLLWAFSKELRALAGMSHLLQNGMAPARVLQEYRVWERRKPLLQETLRRVPLSVLRHCLMEAARVDQAIKGIGEGDPWDGFTTIILWLSGKLRPTRLALA
ncbi:MAG: DNA polymerase III subunit delta [Pseudomonadota bacterium]|nr:DNA polymerase III subunit delta [Pseudomonadales bacterium]MDY6919058.1 DNA polymerase III subunit delta [Pseudomonadota bacterium]